MAVSTYSDIQRIIDYYESNGTAEQLHIICELPNIINYAERLFGVRDISFSLNMVYFSDMLSAPNLPDNKYDIHILKDTSVFLQSIYQLSQEWVHVHAPTGKLYATNLEEGLTIYYAREYLKAYHTLPFEPPGEQHIKYREALVNVSELLSLDRFAIFKLRSSQFTLSNISESDIINLYPSVRQELARALSISFY